MALSPVHLALWRLYGPICDSLILLVDVPITIAFLVVFKVHSCVMKINIQWASSPVVVQRERYLSDILCAYAIMSNHYHLLIKRNWQTAMSVRFVNARVNYIHCLRLFLVVEIIKQFNCSCGIDLLSSKCISNIKGNGAKFNFNINNIAIIFNFNL